ncbi:MULTISPECIES: CHAT domain-containing protein [unclassified Rathayibacter]|uniref:CHAT domain-containing protein n=1 Tax=unclassified Rathayibacter TaxID=2609250 RepID=UPI0006F7EC26|nr:MULTISPECIES: CHAT domain-containing protein [unclassified Rathayibacter]KQQ05697.1 hypothetical protein ASF42_03795 [Rathayibacter sp. Leaf294]KQS13555.1 hypothetical protein ASG06_03805 [Rathayibacter sp. Leaf185]
MLRPSETWFYADAAARIVATRGSDRALSRVVTPRDRRQLARLLTTSRTRHHSAERLTTTQLFEHVIADDVRAASVAVKVVDRVSRSLDLVAEHEVPPAEPEPEPSSSASRWLNVEFEDQPPEAAFEADEWYTLAIDFSATRRRSALGGGSLPVFPEGVDVVEFGVRLDGINAEIDKGVRRLRVRRDEKRPQIVRLDFRPEEDGPCTLRVILLRKRNFVLAVSIDFEIGVADPRPRITFDGRPFAAAITAEPRFAHIRFDRSGDDRLRCTATGPGTANPAATLPLAASSVSDAAAAVYRQLDLIASSIDLGDIPVSEGVITPLTELSAVEMTPDRAAAVDEWKYELALRGRNLFNRLFLSDPANTDAVRMGEWLLTVLGGEESSIVQVTTYPGLTLPWGLLYLGPAVRSSADVRWDHFLGVRHTVEVQTRSTYGDASSALSAQPSLSMAFTGYRAEPGEIVTDAVDRQLRYFRGVAKTSPRLAFRERAGREGAMKTLVAPSPPGLVYFFCHGETAASNATDGLGSMLLKFAPNRAGILKLDQLAAADPSPGVAWRKGPLVVLNACQVGRQADGDTFDFVTRLLQKEARGVIASHAYVPVTFGDSWAQSFFMRFFAGETVGEILRVLTLHSLKVWGVPLGLVYTATCDIDTRLDPPVL